MHSILGITGAASKIITLIKESMSETFKFIKKLESALYAAELVLFILGTLNHVVFYIIIVLFQVRNGCSAHLNQITNEISWIIATKPHTI